MTLTAKLHNLAESEKRLKSTRPEILITTDADGNPRLSKF